jgi:hypothetical protein
MTDNLRHWNALSRTDPKHTKPFQRAGGFKGTAIKPIYAAHKMTERFGPCGSGWGMTAPTFQTVAQADEVLVYCTVGLWYRDGEKQSECVYGVGGDKAVTKNKNGPVHDDEAFKKAYTDALSNAMKQIGVGADVHMGMFEDAKYVNELKREFAEEEEKPAPKKAPDSYAIPVKPIASGSGSDWPRWKAIMLKSIEQADSVAKIDKLMKDNQSGMDGLHQHVPAAWGDINQVCAAKRDQLSEKKAA